jgi:pimeloyl-ACP methyl ester carboxylesterase
MGQQSGTFQSTWVDVNGLPVHTVVSTAPVLPGVPTVILVHGLGLSHRYMIPIAARLAPVYRVYIPDLPGFGDSGKPSRVLDVPGLADALAAWMRTVRLGHAALFGNSFGCQIIVDLAARYPEQVERAVLQGADDGSNGTVLVLAIRALAPELAVQPAHAGAHYAVRLSQVWSTPPVPNDALFLAGPGRGKTPPGRRPGAGRPWSVRSHLSSALGRGSHLPVATRTARRDP